MDFSRFILCLFFLLCAFQKTYSAENTIGIVLVHGTNDHRLNADGGYWKKEFINTLTQALPNPDNYLVVACDFSQYMWHEDAAGCAANQMIQFIEQKNITQMVVYTHSNGGNIIRFILSNPTYDPRFLLLVKKIHSVIAIAPSSAGTPLADEAMNGNLFSKSLSWILGYQNNAVRQQQTSDMAIYNKELLAGTAGRPLLPVPFRVIVGSDVHASPFNKSSYCNGYQYSVGLKMTKLYLEKCSDGFLNCSSQSMAGTLWFYDISKTTNKMPLSHNQSRYDCFNLAHILQQDLRLQGATP